jgi:ketosteroid isomerase-like protein
MVASSRQIPVCDFTRDGQEARCRELHRGIQDGGHIDALFCDVFHFRDDKICRLVTYQVLRALLPRQAS